MKITTRILSFILVIAMAFTFASAVEGVKAKNVLFQISNTSALVNGAVSEVTSSSGDSIAPYYYNNAYMLPLIFIADKFDMDIFWNAYTKQTEIVFGSSLIGLTAGSSEITVNGKKMALGHETLVYSGSTYIPVEVIDYIDGLYYHVFSEAEGSFVLVSSNKSEVSDSDALKSHSRIGLRLLGPSKSEITKNSLTFRCGSMYSLQYGAQTEISSDGKSAAPFCTSDGYLMIPLQYTLSATGNDRGYIKYSDCCDFSYGGKEYSVYYGEHFVMSGGKQYSNKYFCQLKGGVVYVSASMFSYISGLSATFVKTPLGVVYSKYSGYSSMANYCKSMVSSLPDKSMEAEAYIALTFDDGPSGALTERLLDGLLERDAHATFFLCDYRIPAYSSPMKRYISEGHEVANHGATHTALTSLSPSSVAEEIDSTNASIYGYTGTTPCLLRPAGGAYNDTVLSALETRGMSCIIWSVDPLDWKLLNTQKVVNNIVSAASDGDIVLLHDLYSTSVDAALQVIDILKERGFAFVTVSELAEIKGYDLTAGGVYHGFK